MRGIFALPIGAAINVSAARSTAKERDFYDAASRSDRGIPVSRHKMRHSRCCRWRLPPELAQRTCARHSIARPCREGRLAARSNHRSRPRARPRPHLPVREPSGKDGTETEPVQHSWER